MIHQKAHDLVGTNEEEAKNLPGSLLGLLLTLPKKVLPFLFTIFIAIAIIICDSSQPSVLSPCFCYIF